MTLTSIKEIRECKECTRFEVIANSKPIACGNKNAKIIILTQDPNEDSQNRMNDGNEPEFIFTEDNDFAVRISNYLFGSKEYSPLIKKNHDSVNPKFNPDNFCWIHAVNVFCKKESLSKAYKHTSDVHLKNVKKEMLKNNNDGILFLIFGGLALSCIKGKKVGNLRNAIEEGYEKEDNIKYLIGYHPSPENRLWHKNDSFLQKQVEIMRRNVKIILT